MCCKGQQNFVNQDDMLEVIYNTFSVQKVHGRTEEVPVQTAREGEILGSARDIRNGNDLLEGDNLYRCDNANDVEMAGEQTNKESGDHDEGPYCSGDECLLFLLILRLRRILVLGTTCQYVVAH